MPKADSSIVKRDYFFLEEPPCEAVFSCPTYLVVHFSQLSPHLLWVNEVENISWKDYFSGMLNNYIVFAQGQKKHPLFQPSASSACMVGKAGVH